MSEPLSDFTQADVEAELATLPGYSVLAASTRVALTNTQTQRIAAAYRAAGKEDYMTSTVSSAGVLGAAKVTIVKTSGVKNDYAGLTEAMAAAVAGDIILLGPGDHTAKIVVFDGLTVMGLDHERTRIVHDFEDGAENLAALDCYAVKVEAGGVLIGVTAETTDTNGDFVPAYDQGALVVDGGVAVDCHGASIVSCGVYALGAAVLERVTGLTTRITQHLGIGVMMGFYAKEDAQLYSCRGRSQVDAGLFLAGDVRAYDSVGESGSGHFGAIDPFGMELLENAEAHNCRGLVLTGAGPTSCGIGAYDNARLYGCFGLTAEGYGILADEDVYVEGGGGRCLDGTGVYLKGDAIAVGVTGEALGSSDAWIGLAVTMTSKAIRCTGRAIGGTVGSIGIQVLDMAVAEECSAENNVGSAMVVYSLAVGCTGRSTAASLGIGIAVLGTGRLKRCAGYSTGQAGIALQGTTNEALDCYGYSTVNAGLQVETAGAKKVSGTFESDLDTADGHAIVIQPVVGSNEAQFLQVVAKSKHASAKSIYRSTAVDIRLIHGVANRDPDANVTITTTGGAANLVVDTSI